MAAPCALFTSCSEFKTNEFIKKILNVSELPELSSLSDGIEAYRWDIETKYYTASINLCTTETRTIGDKSFADSVQAFIIHFNNNEETGLKPVDCWLPYLDQLDAQIKILVCETATDSNAVSRVTIQRWCINHGFELVELEPEETSDSEDDFAETTGIKRVIQALHSHTWPNLCMKDDPDVRSPYIKQLMREESESKLLSCSEQCEQNSNISNSEILSGSNIDKTDSKNKPSKDSELNNGDAAAASGDSMTENVGNHHIIGGKTDGIINKCVDNNDGSTDNCSDKQKSKKTKEERIDPRLPDEEQAIFDAIGQDNTEEESFEQLFQKLKLMKDKAESMPFGERKVYAEKVAVSFWKAIGGEEGEIDGLTDSDDEGT